MIYPRSLPFWRSMLVFFFCSVCFGVSFTLRIFFCATFFVFFSTGALPLETFFADLAFAFTTALSFLPDNLSFVVATFLVETVFFFAAGLTVLLADFVFVTFLGAR